MSHSTAERCALYCRVSDPGQSTSKEQERWGRGVAEAGGWPVAAVVHDEGLSGDDLTRPGLAELERVFSDNHAAGRPVVRLLVQKTDRLSRSDTLDAFAVLARLRRWGLRYVVTTQRTIDLQNRLDRTLYALEQDHSNNPFLATMAERALGGMVEVARAGFWVGRVPLGYRLVKTPGQHGAGKRRRSGVLEVDPATAPLVVELFEKYAGGQWSTTDLATWLTPRVKPPSAPRWSAQTIRQVLLNPVYIGTRVFGKRAGGKHVRLGDAGPIPQDESLGEDNTEAALVIKNAVPAVVGEELFREVRVKLEGGRRRGHHEDAVPLPLSGLGKCGACGGVLHAVWAALPKRKDGTRPKTRRLICANRHRYGVAACPDGSTGCSLDHVLDVAFGLLDETMLAEGAAERLTLLAEQRVAEADRQGKACRDALLRRLADLEASLTRSQRRLVEAPEDLLADYQAGVRRLRQEKVEAEAELRKMDDAKAAVADLDPARLRGYWETCRRAVELYRSAPDGIPAELVAELIEGFTVFWGKDLRGRATPQRVEVELPKWLTALAGRACHSSKRCELPIVVSSSL